MAPQDLLLAVHPPAAAMEESLSECGLREEYRSSV